MEAVKDSVISIVRHYLTSAISTGDRGMDAQLVILGNVLITFLISLTVREYMYKLWRKYTKHKRPKFVKSTNVFTDEEFQAYSEILKENETSLCRNGWSKATDKFHMKLCELIMSTIQSHHKTRPLIRNLENGKIISTTEWSTPYDKLICSVTDKDTLPVFVSENGIVGITYDTGLCLISTNNESYMDFLVFFNAQNTKPITPGKNLFEWVNTGTPELVSTIYPNRNLDNYVSKHKSTIVKHIDRVLALTNASNADDILGSYNVGILLSGKPGTGKTALVKAICAYTKRDGMMIYPKKLRTTSDFKNIFKGRCSDYIFIMEEIDLIAGVLTRDTVQVPDKDVIEQRKAMLRADKLKLMEMSFLQNKETKIQDLIRDVDKQIDDLDNSLCLDTILTVLDGMDEMRGRIIIATTNCPEKLDPAVTRKGRFDVHINLEEFTHEEIIEFLALVYKEQFPDVSNKTFTTGKFTPVQILNMCREKSMDAVIHELSEII